eukprot:snap_masked-scaffold_2-processed-gene-7.39-mRNA-1 protein AED:1.00 eAED:1.00 QI:0/0/0/0/1/1/2/0/60
MKCGFLRLCSIMFEELRIEFVVHQILLDVKFNYYNIFAVCGECVREISNFSIGKFPHSAA